MSRMDLYTLIRQHSVEPPITSMLN